MADMRMLGIVTLYNPDKEQALRNISLYAPYLDCLIVWDNSPESHEGWFHDTNIQYHWTGENTCIAPALNYAWHKAGEDGYRNILIMDEDSQWDDFKAYRRDIEVMMSQGHVHVFTPYVKGCDVFDITEEVQPKRLFINSGTVIPVEILNAIGGVDEKAFPLDALDHDIALSVIEHGYKAVCLTRHILNHSLGQPQRLGPFRLFTPDYNAFRTYNMTRSHIICYRRHRAMMTPNDKDFLFKEILLRKFGRIILAEPDKYNRMAAFIKGIISGLTYTPQLSTPHPSLK